jgi:hypothetical protein
MPRAQGEYSQVCESFGARRLGRFGAVQLRHDELSRVTACLRALGVEKRRGCIFKHYPAPVAAHPAASPRACLVPGATTHSLPRAPCEGVCARIAACAACLLRCMPLAHANPCVCLPAPPDRAAISCCVTARACLPCPAPPPVPLPTALFPCALHPYSRLPSSSPCSHVGAAPSSTWSARCATGPPATAAAFPPSP